MKQYQLDLANIEQQQSKIDIKNDQVIKQYHQKINDTKKVIDIGQSNAVNISPTDGDQHQYSGSKSWTNLKSQIIDKDIHIVATGKVTHFDDLKNGNYAVHIYSDTDGKITNANIIKSIQWHDVDLQGNVVVGDKITEVYQQVTGLDNKLYDVLTGNTTKVFSVKSDEWFKISQAVTLANNTKKDLLVKLTKSGTPLTYGDDWMVVWNANDAINYYDGAHAITSEAPDNAISATYKIADTSDKFLWTAATFDIDGGQYMTLHTKDSAIVSIGGGLKMKDKIVSADEQLGYTWGKNYNDNALDGTNSTPDGLMIFTEFANEISHTLGGNSRSVANADFGISINASIAEYPILEKKLVIPLKPQLIVPPNRPQVSNSLKKPILTKKFVDKPLPSAPKPPVLKSISIKPKAPTLKALPEKPLKPNYQTLPKQPQPPILHYHYHKLAMQPKVSKTITNNQNVNIANQLVPKLSEVQWHLNTALLPAYIEKINKYILTDYLPSGFSIDLSATQKLNDNFNLTFNKNQNYLQLQATPQYLNYLNKDLSQAIMSISPIIKGILLNDGANYINNFKIQINDYTHYSNNVQVSTPGNPNDKEHPHNNLIQPIKHNLNNQSQIMDRKAVLPNTVNKYHLLWDLDQYKDIIASSNMINKGFYYIDDYPEDILKPNLDEILIKDDKQQVVTDIMSQIYYHLTEAPEEVQQILFEAHIHPKGAFQIFYPKNPYQFYQQYVKQVKGLLIINPLTFNTKWIQQGGEYNNQAY